MFYAQLFIVVCTFCHCIGLSRSVCLYCTIISYILSLQQLQIISFVNVHHGDLILVAAEAIDTVNIPDQ